MGMIALGVVSLLMLVALGRIARDARRIERRLARLIDAEQECVRKIESDLLRLRQALASIE